MSAHGKHRQAVVRPHATRMPAIVLSFVVFGLTAGIVYWRGHMLWTPVDSQPTYTATVYVVQDPVAPTDSAPPPTSMAVAQTAATAAAAQAAAQAEAAKYIAQLRAQWKFNHEGPYRKAQAAADQARLARDEAATHLQVFCEQLDSTAANEPQAPPPPPTAAAPTMVDNPRWQKLQQQLAALQQSYDDLLVARTPAHPEVQDVAARIAVMQKQLAAVPQQIAAASAGAPPASVVQQPAPPTVARQAPEIIARGAAMSPQHEAKWNRLVADVERTRRACQEAEIAERMALKNQGGEPTYTITPGPVAENSPPIDYGWRRLLATTLMSGMLMALGFGSFCTGTTIELPLTSAAQVEREMGLPILGTVPAADADERLAANMRRRAAARRILMWVGMIVMCVCPVLAVWGIMGV